MELPQITHSSHISELLRQLYQNSKNDKHKRSPVVSVKKYFQVKSQNQDTLVEEEEGDVSQEPEEVSGKGKAVLNAGKGSPHHKDSVKDTGERSKEAYRDGRDARHKVDKLRRKEETAKHRPSTSSSLTREHSMTLTRGQKEKLITDTAHALGVVSRDWAKIPGRIKMMQTKETESSGKLERQVSASGGSSSHYAKASSRNESGKGYRNQIATPAPTSRGTFRTKAESSPKTPAVHTERSGDVEKIEKLKSIYDTGSQSRNRPRSTRSIHPSRQVSRCGSRHPSRPATRMRSHGTQHLEQEEIKGWKYSLSRPTTRMRGGTLPARPATRMGGAHHKSNYNNINSLEESTYWNELPPQENAASATSHATGTNNTAVFNVVDSSVSESRKKTVPDPSTLHAALTVSTGWNEELSLMVSKKRREMGGKEASTDKIAQAISLAMKFRQPR